MGVLIEGVWRDEELPQETGGGGEFKRVESAFRSRISADGSSGFKAEAGRCHLYLAHNCPWAHRVLLYLVLKQLTGKISVAYAIPGLRENWRQWFENLPSDADLLRKVISAWRNEIGEGRAKAKDRGLPPHITALGLFALAFVGIWLGFIVLDGATYLLLVLILLFRFDLPRANALKVLLLATTTLVPKSIEVEFEPVVK